MAIGKKVLIIGPGFIGWNVLDLLVNEGYSVTGFARRQEHADGLKASGATDVILGDLDDKAKIAELTEQHDIIIHTATADHLPSVQAALDGLRSAVDAGLVKERIFIHTSGTSVFDDNAKGAFKSDKVYRDDDPDDIDTVADTAIHREIDLTILHAARGSLGRSVRMAIMTPPMIYGWTHDRGSIQVPTITRFALKHGFAPVIGKGLSVESNIHVLDLARGYICLLHHLETTSPEAASKNIYWFCENTGDEEPSWYEYSEAVSKNLHAAGKIPDPKPQELKDESLWGDLFGSTTPPVMALNSRTRAVRLRELGWEAKEKDWYQSYVEDELPNILKGA